jgi:hypothetical protein
MQINSVGSIGFGCKNCDATEKILRKSGAKSHRNIRKWIKWQTGTVNHKEEAQKLRERLENNKELTADVARIIDRLKFKQKWIVS